MPKAKTQRYQGEADEARFWEKVKLPDPSTGCMVWIANTNKSGYGIFWDVVERRKLRAHRVSYSLRVGPLEDGLEVDHLCRNRSCVRPDHLELVTTKENLLRGKGLTALHASRTHCPQGHPYTEENTRRYRGSRYCRECQRIDQWRRRNRADTL